jgi:hypothetical protein
MSLASYCNNVSIYIHILTLLHPICFRVVLLFVYILTLNWNLISLDLNNLLINDSYRVLSDYRMALSEEFKDKYKN